MEEKEIEEQYDQIGLFLTGNYSNFLTKVARISVEFRGYLKKIMI